MSCAQVHVPKNAYDDLSSANSSWLLKVSTTIGFGALFFTAASGMLVSLIILNSNEPWIYDFDYEALTYLVSDYLGEESIRGVDLGAIGFEGLVNIVGIDLHLARSLLKFIYDLLFYGLFSCSVLLFLIIFLASSNRVLISAIHLVLCSLLLGLHWLKFNGLNLGTRHDRLFYTLLIVNLIGAVSYVVFAHRGNEGGVVVAQEEDKRK